MQPFGRLRPLLAELLVLVGVITVASVAGAFYTFRSLGQAATETAMLFALCIGLGASLPFALYTTLRLRQLLEANSGLSRAMTTDPLTGVLNRRGFEAEMARLTQGLGLQPRDGGIALLIVDADHFKRINDRLGHPAGDRALKAIAATMKGSLRASDVVGRLGGEEFAIALNCKGIDQAEIVAERIRRAVARLSVGEGAKVLPLAVSIGGTFSRSPHAYSALYRSADENLYTAKKAGRNRFVIREYEPAGGRYFRGIAQAGRLPLPR